MNLDDVRDLISMQYQNNYDIACCGMEGKGKKPGAHSKLSLEDKQKKKEEVDKKRREAAERKNC